MGIHEDIDELEETDCNDFYHVSKPRRIPAQAPRHTLADLVPFILDEEPEETSELAVISSIIRCYCPSMRWGITKLKARGKTQRSKTSYPLPSYPYGRRSSDFSG